MSNVAMFSHLTDEHLQRMFHTQAATIVHVHGMPEEKRNKASEKGTSPAQAVQVNAHFFVGAAREMERRGMLPHGWLDADD